ncbi:MAG TPA: chemotaxis protein CheB [Terriglobales bacterium]|nr:chemotaxis protein CheB [Terriglobales bacterium]
MGQRNIIVIGGSAGALQVLQAIFPALPWDFPASVFVVVHTSEESPGVLPEILNRCSKLPVIYAVHNAPILPARVYIAPAGQRHVLLDRGTVRLETGPRENRSRPAIDVLFRSASYAYGNQVIGVVLTGNLDDGTAGLLDIKNRGGIAIVQDPEEALASSMPSSAIETADADFVLPAEAIGPKLVELTAVVKANAPQLVPNGGSSMASTGQTYSCPECGGVLEETKEAGMLRFRCRVGHLYSPESLSVDQTEAVERALWAAIRSMEEQAEFSNRLAENSREKRRIRLARRFAEKAESSRENANVLRDLLQKTGDQVLEMPLEVQSSEFDEKTGTA